MVDLCLGLHKSFQQAVHALLQSWEILDSVRIWVLSDRYNKFYLGI